MKAWNTVAFSSPNEKPSCRCGAFRVLWRGQVFPLEAATGLRGGVTCAWSLLAQMCPFRDTKSSTNDFGSKVVPCSLLPEGCIRRSRVPRGPQLCLVCELRVWNACGALCFHSRSISDSPLCSLSEADQVLNGGQVDPLPGAMLRTPSHFAEWGCQLGLVSWREKCISLYHFQSRRSHQWYFNCIPSSCLHSLLPNMSKFVPKWFQTIFSFSSGTKYFKGRCVAQTYIRVRSLTVWNWYSDSNLFWHQKLDFLKWYSSFFTHLEAILRLWER